MPYEAKIDDVEMKRLHALRGTTFMIQIKDLVARAQSMGYGVPAVDQVEITVNVDEKGNWSCAIEGCDHKPFGKTVYTRSEFSLLRHIFAFHAGIVTEPGRSAPRQHTTTSSSCFNITYNFISIV